VKGGTVSLVDAGSASEAAMPRLSTSPRANRIANRTAARTAAFRKCRFTSKRSGALSACPGIFSPPTSSVVRTPKGSKSKALAATNRK
jgi:hypothetical protein